MDPHTIARLYLVDRNGQEVTLGVPGSSYRLQFQATGEVAPSPQGRVRGVVRLPVWKVDFVSAGGSYIEPIFGRPRRVQGKAIGFTGHNGLIVEVCGQPIVGELPPRWSAASIAPGTRVALDVKDGGVFDPLDPAANREPVATGLPTTNLSAA